MPLRDKRGSVNVAGSYGEGRNKGRMDGPGMKSGYCLGEERRAEIGTLRPMR